MRPPELAPRSGARVRRPLLKGRQPVAGLWFPADGFDEAERARRLLAAWRPGATALRFPQGDLLRYAAPLEQDCESLPGWALRREGAALSSAMLDEAERATLPPADLWIVRGGDVLALPFDQGTPLDPARWLALQGPALHDTYDCRDTLPEPVVLAPDARPMREVLDGIPPASAEQAAFREALAQAARAKAPGTGAESAHAPAGTGRGWRRAIRWAALGLGIVMLPRFLRDTLTAIADGQVPWALLALVAAALLLRRLARAGRSAIEDRTSSPQAAPGGSPGAQPLPARRPRTMPQRWREWLARLAYSTQLGRLLGRQHAAYMRRMLELFDRGDLAEALRHAVPLGGDDAGSLGQAFGALGPRRDLSLSPALGHSTSLHFGTRLQEHLRQLYRRSFERLDREGRIDEAVFVLAELLGARQEALDYLEQHQRYAQAAELALAWDRPADVIVRLHCLAGDWQRALAVARRDGAFANAVLQLEKKWPDAAHRLRAEWGDALVQQGDWLAAVDAVWPVKALREQAATWLLAAESAGGQLAARALVRRALILPDTMATHAERLRSLRDERALYRERAALAEALLAAAKHGEASRALAAVVAGAVLADHAEGQGRLGKPALQRLMTVSGDPLLQADLPGTAWPEAAPRPLAGRDAPLECEAPAGGAHAVLDAVPLEDRRYLLALGEAGAAIVGGDGEVLTRFSVPAQRLVVASSGQVALALARRDRVWRVSRIDLAQRRVSDLGQCEFDAFATEFDGIGWTVGRGARLQVLDTGRSLHDVLWQVTDLPGPVLAIQSAAGIEQAIVGDGPEHHALWRYAMPQRRLLSREPMPERDADSMHLLHPLHGVVQWRCTNPQPGTLQVRWSLAGRTHELMLAGDDVVAAALGGSDWMLLSAGPAPGTMCLADLRRGSVGAVVRWPQAADISARCCNAGWMLFDGHGRVLHLDTESSEVVRFSLH